MSKIYYDAGVKVITSGRRLWKLMTNSKLAAKGMTRRQWLQGSIATLDAVHISDQIWRQTDEDPHNDPEFWEIMLSLAGVGFMFPGVSKRVLSGRLFSESKSIQSLYNLPKLIGLKTFVQSTSATFGRFKVVLDKASGTILSFDKFGKPVLGISKEGIKSFRGKQFAFAGGSAAGLALLIDALDGDIDALNLLSSWLDFNSSAIAPSDAVTKPQVVIQDAVNAIQDPDHFMRMLELREPSLDSVQRRQQLLLAIRNGMELADEMNEVDGLDAHGIIVEDPEAFDESEKDPIAEKAIATGETVIVDPDAEEARDASGKTVAEESINSVDLIPGGV